MKKKSGMYCLTGAMLLLYALESSVYGAAKGNDLAALKSEHMQLLEGLNQQRTSPPYLVIDTYNNQLYVRDSSHKIIRQVICATGNGRKLEGAKPRHKWEFKTPKGRFSVLRKVADPIWVKPEWHFVENGEEIPVFAEDRRRFERGVLGEYALYFLKDYMIHGTIYEINLGKNITHGCVRVGREDLHYLYDVVKVGTPIFIY